jgi:hypothetical protein
VFLGRKGIDIENVVFLFERLFVDAGLLALAIAAYHGHTTVLDDLVDRLHRARCGLPPAADVSRNATCSGEQPRSPLFAINDMHRVEAPNIEWAVKLEVRDARIMEMVPEVVYLFHLLKRALPDLKIEAGIYMLLGEAFDRHQPGRTDDNRCSSSAPLILQELHRSKETHTRAHDVCESK